MLTILYSIHACNTRIRIRVRVPRPIYPEFVSVIETSRSVFFVRYRGRQSNCRVHLCDWGISCTRIDCACADDLLPYVPFSIHTATGDVVKVVYESALWNIQNCIIFRLILVIIIDHAPQDKQHWKSVQRWIAGNRDEHTPSTSMLDLLVPDI